MPAGTDTSDVSNALHTMGNLITAHPGDNSQIEPAELQAQYWIHREMREFG
jgi:hypothetical protein